LIKLPSWALSSFTWCMENEEAKARSTPSQRMGD
jgi:hypothetical protein